MKIHYYKDFQYWYDRSNRCWWIARFDSDGNQIGAANHAYTKEEVLLWV